jgi:hypothetical protein
MLSAWLHITPPGFRALAIMSKNGFSTNSCAGPVKVSAAQKRNKINEQRLT